MASYRAPFWATPQLLAALRSNGIKQARFHRDGHWYHQLREFPGALCDSQGFLAFKTEAAFRNCPGLVIIQDVNMQVGRTIATLPGYVRVPAES
jgi:5-methylcytosine-specific restriction protein A